MPNEPIYDGVPIGKLIDKPIYAKNATTGFQNSSLTKIKHQYKSGDFIGNLFSYAIVDGNVLLLFYTTNIDYNNFQPTYVKLLNGNTTSPDLPQIKQDIKDAKNASIDATKTTLQIYIEKYAPYIVGALVVSIALPAIANTIEKKRIGSMTNKNKNLLVGAGVVVLLLAFKKPKHHTSIIIAPIEDITEWPKTNNNTVKPQKKPIILRPRATVEDIVLQSQLHQINGINKYKKIPIIC